MLRRLLLVAAACLCALPAAAQTATPTSKIGFDEAAPTLAVAQANTYKTYADGATTGTALAGVTCTGSASPFQCEAPFPAFTPTSHTIAISAANSAGESLPSTPLAFVFSVLPTIPTNVHAIP